MQVTFPQGKIFARGNNIIKVQQENEIDGSPILTIGGMQFKRSFPFTILS